MSVPFVAPNWVGVAFDALCPGRHTLIGAAQIVVELQTDYQQLVIADVPTLGRGLFLDGNVQLLAYGEQTYHERLALLPVLIHPSPKHVLILGGGDGCAAREALRDPRVERVTLVELDPAVIDACATHLATLNGGSLRDPRVVIVPIDARLFLQHANPADYDVVIIDFLDAYTAADLALYDHVLTDLGRRVAPTTLVSLHGDLANPPYWSALRLHALTSQRFPHVGLHSAFVACYQSEWGFLLAGHAAPFAERLTAEQIRKHATALTDPLQTLVPEIFPAALQLTPHLTDVAAHIAEDPYRLPDNHQPEAHWVTHLHTD